MLIIAQIVSLSLCIPEQVDWAGVCPSSVSLQRSKSLVRTGIWQVLCRSRVRWFHWLSGHMWLAHTVLRMACVCGLMAHWSVQRVPLRMHHQLLQIRSLSAIRWVVQQVVRMVISWKDSSMGWWMNYVCTRGNSTLQKSLHWPIREQTLSKTILIILLIATLHCVSITFRSAPREGWSLAIHKRKDSSVHY